MLFVRKSSYYSTKYDLTRLNFNVTYDHFPLQYITRCIANELFITILTDIRPT